MSKLPNPFNSRKAVVGQIGILGLTLPLVVGEGLQIEAILAISGLAGLTIICQTLIDLYKIKKEK